MIRVRALACSFAVLLLLASAGAAPAQNHVVRPAIDKDLPERMKAVDTPEYTVYSDLPKPLLEEVVQRLERMVQEYRDRTDFLSDARDTRKLPLYLFSNRADYTDRGGLKETAGFFDGERLLAYIGTRPDARAWHVIQHEAFHQYLAGKLGHEVPVWLNEGLAEYFGESMFTGDGFVSGVVPPWRLKRMQDNLKTDKMPSVAEMLAMPHERWNAQMRQENYDMAWSLVQFLAHGDDGKYQAAMVKYVQAARTERQAARAFAEIFGPASAVQERWREYWLQYPTEQSRQSFAIAAVQTVCSYVARAGLAKQNIRSMQQLEMLLANNELRQPRGDTLPTSLLAEYMQWAPKLGVWDLSPRGGMGVELTLDGGTRIKGRYALRNNKVESTEAWLDDGKPQPPKRPRRR